MPSNPCRISITGPSTTGGYGFYAPDYYVRPFNIGIGVTTTSTNATVSVEHTFDYTGSSTFISSNAVWMANSGISGATVVSTTPANGNYAYPVSAIRLNITAGATAVGCVTTMTLIQAG